MEEHILFAEEEVGFHLRRSKTDQDFPLNHQIRTYYWDMGNTCVLGAVRESCIKRLTNWCFLLTDLQWRLSPVRLTGGLVSTYRIPLFYLPCLVT